MHKPVAKIVEAPTELSVGLNPLQVYWDDLRVLVAVARTGSFTRAAVELNIAQPTVARRIETLEALMGVPLFSRTPRGPLLTPEGELVLKEAQVIELSVRRAFEHVRGAVSGVAGECKLLVPEGLNSYWLARFLPTFLQRHPNVDLRLFSALDQSVSQRPPFDVQIQFSAATDGDSVPVRLGTLHLVLFASEDYLANHGTPNSTADLHRHRMLDHTQSLTSKGRWTSFSESQGAIRTAVFTNSSAVLVEAIRRGIGMALLPTYAGAIEPTFRPVLSNHKLTTGIFANFHRDVGHQPAVRATIGFLKEVVFDKRLMPWFREDFEEPQPNWRAQVMAAESQAMGWEHSSDSESP